MPNGYKKYRKSSQSRKTSSGWVWFFIGVFVGVFLMSLVWLKLGTSVPEKNRTAQSAQTTRRVEKKPVDQTKKTPNPTPRQVENQDYYESEFGFFEQLPKREVKVNTKPLALREKKAEQSQAKHYVLQIASFRHIKEAERLRAELALSGIETQINQVQLNNTPYYRVVTGTFTQLAEVKQVEQLLYQQGHRQLLMLHPGL